MPSVFLTNDSAVHPTAPLVNNRVVAREFITKAVGEENCTTGARPFPQINAD